MNMLSGLVRQGYAVIMVHVISCFVFFSDVSLFSADNSSKPNIVLIMADDLGYECLGCYGGNSYKTPVLDNLAATGMRFEHCYSQPLCTPSRVQLMTGRYNFRNYKMFGYFDIEEITFAHILKKAGYKTCIAGKWQLGNGIEGPNLAGFDEYALWQIYRKIANEWVVGPRYADPKIYRNGKLMQNTKGRYGPDVVCDFILDFISRNSDNPFLVYYPMILPHSPFMPTPDSPEWATDRYKRDNRYFADMVAYVDKNVGRIVRKLDELELREHTVLMFIGDNGTHRNITSTVNGNSIQGGKSLMTDAGTHVPFIANWPGTISPGTISGDLIDFSDFFPTMVEIAGADLPDDVAIDGNSFFYGLKGETGDPRDWIYMYYWGRGRDPLSTRSLARTRIWKLYDDGSFFNIPNDPLEKHDMRNNMLSREAARVRKQLMTVLDHMQQQIDQQ